MPEDIYGNQISEEEWRNSPPEMGGPAPGYEDNPFLQLSQNEGEQFRIPEDATVAERDANDNPIAYNYRGEKYFAPGSIAYESGFRTETERIQANAGEGQVGLAHGRLVPENTVIVTDDRGKPIRRYSQNEIGKMPSGLREFENIGLTRYPVKDELGKEVLLTKDERDRLADAKDDKERLEIAKDLKLVPKDMTLKEFTGE